MKCKPCNWVPLLCYCRFQEFTTVFLWCYNACPVSSSLDGIYSVLGLSSYIGNCTWLILFFKGDRDDFHRFFFERDPPKLRRFSIPFRAPISPLFNRLLCGIFFLWIGPFRWSFTIHRHFQLVTGINWTCWIIQKRKGKKGIDLA